MTDRDFSDLDAELQPIARKWLDTCAAQGLNVKIIVTWRSAADQQAAHEQGLSNAGAGESPHNMVDDDGNPASCAFDFACFESDGSYITNGEDKRYAQGGAIGKSLSLVWGGDFKSFRDPDHLELADWRD